MSQSPSVVDRRRALKLNVYGVVVFVVAIVSAAAATATTVPF
jgi:hypothetical protein